MPSSLLLRFYRQRRDQTESERRRCSFCEKKVEANFEVFFFFYPKSLLPGGVNEEFSTDDISKFGFTVYLTFQSFVAIFLIFNFYCDTLYFFCIWSFK